MDSQVFTPEQRKELLARLQVPFPDELVEWRITAESRDGKKGLAVAYANRRAYADRLSAVFGPDGWTDEYFRHTSPTQRIRQRDGKTFVINSSKISVFCKVTITGGLGFHTGDGEAWADDENGETRASAQAFRRACCEFGLGRYFYNLADIWVPLDQYGKIIKKPTLPAWALPPVTKNPAAAASAVGPARNANGSAGVPAKISTTVTPTVGARPSTSASTTSGLGPTPALQRATQLAPAQASANDRIGTPTTPMVVLPGEIANQKVRDQINAYSRPLGVTLYAQIVQGTKDAIENGQLPKGDMAKQLLRYLQIGQQFLNEARQLAPQVLEGNLHALMDRHRIPSLATVPALNVLKSFVEELRTLPGSAKDTRLAAQTKAA